MMSVGMHMRIIGHAGRAAGLCACSTPGSKRGVWITRRVDIANHCVKTHPYAGRGLNE
jgi:allantoinase